MMLKKKIAVSSVTRSSKMFTIWYGYGAVLLFVVTRSFASTNLTNGQIGEAVQFIEVNTADSVRISADNSQIRDGESTCQRDYDRMIAAYDARQRWALRMRDASSKLQSGIVSGNIRDLGMYDQCISVTANSNWQRIQGQHCLYTLSDTPGTGSSATSMSANRILTPFDAMYASRASAAGFDISSYSSACVPSSCNETEVVDLMNQVLKDLSETHNTVQLTANDAICARIEPEDYGVGEIVTILFFLMVGIFIIFCTFCEFLRFRPGKSFPVIHTLAQFSMYKNLLGLLNTSSERESMPVIHGLRFLSMCWVIIGHRYTFSLMRPLVNLYEVQEWSESWHALYILMAPFAVDTFFTISGFLLTYSYLNTVRAGKPYNVPLSIVHRYIRLTPPLAVLILFAAVLLHRVGSGAAWEPVSNILVVFCQENWWTNLLYVQNYVKADEMCFIHSWYLAVDMHLFLISPIILYPLWKWPKVGMGILLFFLVAAMATTTTLFVVMGYRSALLLFPNDVPPAQIYNNFLDSYIPTHHRACAYFIGMALGNDLATKTRRPTKVNIRINWIVTCILLAYCGWATSYLYRPYYRYNYAFEGCYALLTRPFWSISIAWIIYASHQGYGGFVTKFLSLPFFVPLSRLSYTTYLSHVMIQILKAASARTPAYFSDFEYFDIFWGDLVLSIMMALVLTLFFESPVRVLEKVLKQSLKKPRRPQANGNSTRV